MMKPVFLLTLMAVLAVGEVQAHDYDLKAIKIGHPWTRPTPEGAKAGAVYLSLTNSGSEADTLIAVESQIAGKTQLHQTIDEGGVMKMRPVEGGIALAPGATVQFKPGGYHIMLLDLKQRLLEGQRFPLTLTFAKSGTIDVEVSVENPSAPETEIMHDHDMKGMDHMR